MLKVMSAVVATAVIACAGAAFAAEQNQNSKNVQPANAVKQESAQARCEKEFNGDKAKVAKCVADAATPAKN